MTDLNYHHEIRLILKDLERLDYNLHEDQMALKRVGLDKMAELTYETRVKLAHITARLEEAHSNLSNELWRLREEARNASKARD